MPPLETPGPTRARPAARLRLAVALAGVLASQACAPIYWLGAKLLYDRAPAPPTAQLNVAYDPAAPDDPKRQLDLYLPGGRDFPLVVFVHGGGWAWGDRTQTFGGADVYRNIGRFLASQGVGAAVINYRLVWPNDWQAQLGDVARALAWVQAHAAERGGRADRIFLMGHSAGAQLAARVATDPAWLAREQGPHARVCGVIAVSGAGYDLGDIGTYRTGVDPLYFAERFGGSRLDGTWWRDASVVPFLDASDPPFLVVSATGESAGLRRQSKLLYRALGPGGSARHPGHGQGIEPRADHPGAEPRRQDRGPGGAGVPAHDAVPATGRLAANPGRSPRPGARC